jgi:hypothetical protein
MSSVWWQLARGRGARWGVVALWVLGAILSYSALRELAVMLGFSDALADLFPLVIDVAVWVGSMNALEAREHGRRMVERYAWCLVALYSSTTVAGNALVASTQAVDPRLLRAIGDGWAHTVSGVAHAAPAVTMILFAHLAGLLMADRSEADSRRSVGRTDQVVTADDRDAHQAPAPWPPADGRLSGQATARDRLAVMTGRATTAIGGQATDMTTAMSPSQARRAVAELIRQSRGTDRQPTTADVQRVTGRGPRQARRLLALASAEVDDADSVTPRPRVVEMDA